MKVFSMLKTPAERLLYARQLVAKNRTDFCDTHDLSVSTLSQVEGGFMDLSEKFSQKIVEALKNEGLMCSTHWLKTGVGNPPESLESLSQKAVSVEMLPEDEERIIFMESAGFEKLNQESIVMSFPVHDMFGAFSVGDTIGGLLIKGSLDPFFGKKVVARLKDQTTWIGFLAKGSKEDTFSVVPFNLHEGASVLYDAQMNEVFEIVWHRKRRY